MRKISLTVNGTLHYAEVEPRTQLAAVLRDRLHLTGTHLACEQGICGACTILVDGKPIRSCITYAPMHDGAVIETIEGFQSDPIMSALRRAFSENHALQCGFCTPGMIITARDIILRLKEPNEQKIRNELSGNLCRCTGYVGIVRAIQAVIRERAATDGEQPAGPASLGARAAKTPLQPFALSDGSLCSVPAEAPSLQQAVTIEDGWTSIERKIALHHSPDQVWEYFSDISRVAHCIPGASVKSMEGDSFLGEIVIRFGMIKAAFVGEGQRTINPRDREGIIDAQGKDLAGQSNVRGQLTYRVLPARDGTEALVEMQLRFRLTGLLAQFNRPDLVEGFLDVLLSQFVSSCEATLSGKDVTGPRELGALRLLLAVAKRRLKNVFAVKRVA
jgi:aerobic carbon-monoxide dehydrogenase small subunit